MIKISMNTSSGCLLSHRFSVAKEAFPAAGWCIETRTVGEPKSISFEQEIFLLNPIIPDSITEPQAPLVKGAMLFPQDTEQGCRTRAGCVPGIPAGSEHCSWAETQQ